MNFVWFTWFFPLLHWINGNETGTTSLWDEEEDVETQRPVYRIHHINIFGDAHFMKALADVNEDRTHFSLNVLLYQELGSNFLVFNIKVRVRPTDKVGFVTLIQMRGLDLCSFFTEFSRNPMLKYFLQTEMQLSDYIVCPVRVGNYTVKNVSAKDIYPQNLQNGTYKFFVEVVESTAEITKVFALQVTSEIWLE